MQAVSHLDHNDTDVFCHGHGHLLEVLSLRFVSTGKNLAQFGNAVNDVRNRGTENFTQIGSAGFRVLNHIMQQCGHQRLMVHVHVG